MYDSHNSSVIDTSVFGCRMEAVVETECKQFFKDNPDLLQFSADCNNPTDKRWTATRWAVTCKVAGLAAWTDIFVRLDQAGKAIDACGARLDCKKNVAAQAYFVCKNVDGSNQYPCTDEAILKDVDIRDLLRKREKVNALAAHDPKYRAALIAKGVPLPEIPNDSLLTELTKSRFDELKIKSKCFNTTGNIHLACTAAATAVDPTLLIGAGPAAGPLVGLKFVAAALRTTARGTAIEASSVPKIDWKKGN